MTSQAQETPSNDAAAPDTAISTPACAAADPVISAPPKPQAGPKQERKLDVQPVLEKLFELYPALFGAEFLPLKLGIFQELLTKHPADFERDTLKAALGLHTRSARYLQAVAAGKMRHDLDGAAVEAVAPEHICLALLELFRRRQMRSRQDLRPEFRAYLVAAFVASGLPRQEYLARVQTKDPQANALLEEAFAQHHEKSAKQEALQRAYVASGKTPAEFADMYGMDLQLVLDAIG